ncbi:biliverdin-producing heme oxygenase [Micromonospora sp. NBC_01796]|uniref:biliverdin-producing heme oxygenase n=1 Tax=Micromonospora sp. NBC_01796 TaxID=2975987 RepID=UPI002DDC3BC5|nr:biliverdin-producing heme oxygenase [Micromonospora sp. NBC_01796]WSA85213.1 biliverdin-producing heme oxygenase [Micromonospora sp. NBC_01796]
MNDTPVLTEANGLAARLRTATDAAHRAAESTPYITALIAGQIPLVGYAALVAQHYFLYETLEQAAEAMRDDPVAGPFVADELTRLPRLAEDLAFLLGPGWREQIAPGAATEAYRDRLREVCFTWPAGFIAHHYTRYLGDLSGGAFVAAAVRRTYGFTTDDGTRFYQFDRIPSRGRFKREYRDRLDALALDAAESERTASEAVIAFDLNREMFHQLGAAHPATP